MRQFLILMMICLGGYGVAQAADADLDAMIEALDAEQPMPNNVPNTQPANAPAEIMPGPDLSQPEASVPPAEEAKIEDTVEEVLVLEVFPPDFMASLRVCRKDSDSKDGRVFEIKGMRNGKCHLTYGNYILDVPTSLLSSIHGFDDLNTFLKNKDMTRYKYLPEYTYEGLIFALNACAHKEKFYGVEEEENRIDATVLRGLSAEYFDEHCEIYLQNELELEFEVRNYSITCRLPQAAIEELEPYFSDIVEKYEELEPTEMHKNKEVRDADIALMYYLQQNNYCHKNNELNQ